MPETKIIFAADLHYLSPGLTDRGPCFRQTTDSGDGKVMDCIEELTDAFLAQIIKERPDALILAGDVSFNGERESHETLAKKLRAVKDSGIPVLVLPGNHDLENARAVRFTGGTCTPVPGVTAEEFAEIYADFGYADALVRDRNSLSCVFSVSDTLRVLVTDVNTAGAPNAVRPETLSWAEQQLRNARRDGVAVLGVSHQNLLPHNRLFVSGYLMENSQALLDLYEQYGVIANLTGHLHCQHISRSARGFFEVATAALSVSPNYYGVLTLNGHSAVYKAVQTDVSGWAEKHGLQSPDLLNFAAYSKACFRRTSIRKTEAAFADTAQKDEMLNCYADMNAAFFSGRMDTITPDFALLDCIEAYDAFSGQYLKSVLDDDLKRFTDLSWTY